MNTPIQKAFAQAKSEGRAALIPFITAGHPSLNATPAIVEAIAKSGADIIEIGIPFSDPLADGPVIRNASLKAIKGGASPNKCLDTVAAIRDIGVKKPIVLMCYFNLILAKGIELFCKSAAEAGSDGLIVPDLPSTEAPPVVEKIWAARLAFIPMVAPTSTDSAISEACKTGVGGFIYCVSSLGITGQRSEIGGRAAQLVKRVRSFTSLPIAVGFGISTARHAREVASYADGVITGSALVAAIDAAPDSNEAEAAEKFTVEIFRGVDPKSRESKEKLWKQAECK